MRGHSSSDSRVQGRTWEAIGSNLPEERVNALVEDPKAAGVLFVGTDLEVFASTDSGASWVSLGRNLPSAPVVDLAVPARDDDAALVGRHEEVFYIPHEENARLRNR